jgi:malonate-semialdehyde dehydrogenase (acetylating)/methylmalonate-semialdehyde dehydrogenase
MIPAWMFPLAITLGNTYVIKPSEKVPGATMLMAKYMNDIGLPKGVLNVVHGGFETVK